VKSTVQTPLDFVAREEAREHLDSISKLLLSVGEAFPQIDEKTQGEFLSPYPEIPRKALIGMCQVLAHDYFNIDEVAIFHICTTNIPPFNQRNQLYLSGN
jgi:uncharacterized protein with HEPN domain